MSVISFVIPCYRSELSIRNVVRDIIASVGARANYQYQIILCCDASPDNTFKVIMELCKSDDRIVGLNLSRNFGQQAARMASLPYVNGDYVVFMDDDGQHPVHKLYDLIDKLEEGFDIVYANFHNKQHSGMQLLGSFLNRIMTEFLIGKPKDIVASSFFVTKKFVVEELKKYQTPDPYISGFLMQITKNIANVDMDHQPRISGKSGYTFPKLLALWFSGVTGFSVKPLRIASFVGFIVAIIGFIYGVFLIVRKVINPDVFIGYTSLMAAILFTAGLIMLMLGLVGEYIGRTYMSMNKLPQFVVRDIVNGDKNRVNE